MIQGLVAFKLGVSSFSRKTVSLKITTDEIRSGVSDITEVNVNEPVEFLRKRISSLSSTLTLEPRPKNPTTEQLTIWNCETADRTISYLLKVAVEAQILSKDNSVLIRSSVYGLALGTGPNPWATRYALLADVLAAGSSDSKNLLKAVRSEISKRTEGDKFLEGGFTLDDLNQYELQIRKRQRAAAWFASKTSTPQYVNNVPQAQKAKDLKAYEDYVSAEITVPVKIQLLTTADLPFSMAMAQILAFKEAKTEKNKSALESKLIEWKKELMEQWRSQGNDFDYAKSTRK
jgi:hypothetical protein